MRVFFINFAISRDFLVIFQISFPIASQARGAIKGRHFLPRGAKSVRALTLRHWGTPQWSWESKLNNYNLGVKRVIQTTLMKLMMYYHCTVQGGQVILVSSSWNMKTHLQKTCTRHIVNQSFPQIICYIVVLKVLVLQAANWPYTLWESLVEIVRNERSEWFHNVYSNRVGI